MVKVFSGISFICLLGIIYFTIFDQKHKQTDWPAISSENALGEKRRRDFPVIKLQRQQIEAATVFRFKSNNNNERYELDDEQLDDFAQNLHLIDNGSEFGKIENYQSTEDKDLYRKEIETREKKYFLYDNEL